MQDACNELHTMARAGLVGNASCMLRPLVTRRTNSESDAGTTLFTLRDLLLDALGAQLSEAHCRPRCALAVRTDWILSGCSCPIGVLYIRQLMGQYVAHPPHQMAKQCNSSLKKRSFLDLTSTKNSLPTTTSDAKVSWLESIKNLHNHHTCHANMHVGLALNNSCANCKFIEGR